MFESIWKDFVFKNPTISRCLFHLITDQPVIIKEWAAYKGKTPHTPELVEALSFREWTCPNLKKLWLGKAVEDKNRRIRAFLACMRSDTPAMLNPANVPTHLMVLCCVLRWGNSRTQTHAAAGLYPSQTCFEDTICPPTWLYKTCTLSFAGFLEKN